MIDFPSFLSPLLASPALFVTVLLTLAVILVNGWTDAPNTVATAVSTKAIAPRPAIIMAAIFNFLGIFVMTSVNKTVAETIYNMVDFGDDARAALVALCAAMVAMVLWAVAAWRFGIPTSESHALIAGLTGAAISIQGGLAGVNGGEWIKVVYGLVLSTFLGSGMGWAVVKLIETVFRSHDRRKTRGCFKNAQIGGAAAMAFMHGAQDGQKFMGVFLQGAARGDGGISQLLKTHDTYRSHHRRQLDGRRRRYGLYEGGPRTV